MQTIEVPGHGPVEFPDDMSDEQIATVLRQHTQWGSPGATLEPNKPKAINIQPDMRQAMRDEMATHSWGANNLAAFGNAIRAPYERVKQIIGSGDTQAIQGMRAMEQEAPIGAIGGNVALGVALPGSTIPRVMASGAAMGAAQPVLENESAAKNIAIGGGLATAGAITMGAIPPVYRFMRDNASKYLGGLLNSRTLMNPAARADITKAVQSMTTDADEQALKAFKQHPFLSHQPTVSQITQSPTIGSAEKASRTVNRDFWLDVDQRAARSRWEALDQVLGTEAAEDAAKAARTAATEPLREKALAGNLKPNTQEYFSQKIDSAAKSDAMANPDVRAVVGYLQSEGSRVDGKWSPAQLYEIRKTLTGWIAGNPPPGSPRLAAPAKDAYLKSVVDGIDQILNTHSKGGFGKYLQKYAEESAPVASARAGRNIRNNFVDEVTGIPRVGNVVDTTSGAPNVTQAQLAASLNRFGKNAKFGKETLDYGTDDVARAVLADLQRANNLQRLAKAQTGGGGSNTAGDLVRAAGGVLGGWKGSLFAKFLGDAGMNRYSAFEQDLLAQALSDPVKFQSVLNYGRTLPALRERAMRRALLPVLPASITIQDALNN